MTDSTNLALRELAGALTRSELERAAKALELTANEQDSGGAPLTAQNNTEAAAQIRALAATGRQPRTLRISYDGDPVRVAPEKITEDMCVPEATEPEAGQAAAALLQAAVTAGALSTPDGLKIECYGDDDIDGGGFTLAVFPEGDPGRGATCGWRDVANLPGDSVEDALDYYAFQLNRALNLG